MDNSIDLGIPNLADAEVIGQGGFSTVYAATDTQFDRRVAVKVLGKLTKDSDRGRFERECKVMGRLSSHPHVVTLYYAGYTNDDEPYIIMELNEGGSLADRMKARGLVRWQDSLRYLIPIADALSHAHKASILHRDIKPENILLAGEVPQLTDFGIAYLRDSTGSTSTSITASWLHTAPETFDNKRDERSDNYSAASTLYNLIVGRAPLENPGDESLNPLIRRLLDESPPPLPTSLAPAALDMFIARSLAKDPDDRPQDAEEFAQGLQLILDSDGLKGPGARDRAGPGSVPSAASSPGSGTVPIEFPPPTGTASGSAASAVGANALRPDPSPGRPDYGSTPPPAANRPAPPVIQGAAPNTPLPTPGAYVQAPPGQPPAGQAPSFYSSPGQPPVSQPPSGSIPSVPATHYNQGPGTGGGGPNIAKWIGLGILALVVVFGGFVVLSLFALFGASEATLDDGVELIESSGERSSTPENEPEPEPVPEDDEATVDEGPDVIPPTFDGPAATLEELEDRWAQSRQAVVTALSSPAYGVGDDNVLRGPGGFEVNLDNCPAGWSDTSPLDQATIRIGHTTAVTGSQAAFGEIAPGLEAYFAYVNAQGGVAGLDLELVVRDDQNEADATVRAVDELVDVENVLAVTTLGTPNTLLTYDELNSDCVPQPFVVTAHPAFGDPVDHPFTSGLQMAWSTEAVLWGTWIEENFAEQLPVRVGAVVMNNDFGLAYESPFRAWADAHPNVIEEVITVAHDPASTNLSTEMATVLESEPDIYISMTAGPSCPRAMQAADEVGLTSSVQALFQPSVCRDIGTYVTPAGDAAAGWLVIDGGQKSVGDPTQAGDPYVGFVREELTAAGLDPDNNLHANGFGFLGWTYVEALRIAAELPGGLSRTNLVLAMRGMDLVHPLLVEGVDFRLSGNEDAFGIEASNVSSFDVATNAWQTGEVVSAAGETPNCSWTVNGC